MEKSAPIAQHTKDLPEALRVMPLPEPRDRRSTRQLASALELRKRNDPGSFPGYTKLYCGHGVCPGGCQVKIRAGGGV